MKISYLFRSIVHFTLHDKSVIFFYDVIAHDLQSSIRSNKNILWMQRKDWLHAFKSIHAGLKNSPKLAFLKILGLIFPSADFIGQSDDGVFIDRIYFIGVGTKVVELFGVVFE